MRRDVDATGHHRWTTVEAARREPPVRGKGSAHLACMALWQLPPFGLKKRTSGVREEVALSTHPVPAPRALPERPNLDHLRGQARVLQRQRGIPLSAAQRALALEYGFASWP